MMNVIVIDIDWDLDDEEDADVIRDSLPKQLEFEVEEGLTDEEIEDFLEDAITEETGWCHKGFKWFKWQFTDY